MGEERKGERERKGEGERQREGEREVIEKGQAEGGRQETETKPLAPSSSTRETYQTFWFHFGASSEPKPPNPSADTTPQSTAWEHVDPVSASTPAVIPTTIRGIEHRAAPAAPATATSQFSGLQSHRPIRSVYKAVDLWFPSSILLLDSSFLFLVVSRFHWAIDDSSHTRQAAGLTVTATHRRRVPEPKCLSSAYSA